jgi:hypothetical protein
MFEGLLLHFCDNSFGKDACMRIRRVGFFVLDFLQANYGLDIMGIEKGEDLEEKMKLISSSFQLMNELKNIKPYVQNRRIGKIENEENKMKLGEDILMIYNFFNLLIERNHHLFPNPEMTAYCQNYKLQKIRHKNQQLINSIHCKYLYYLHH